jgi:hypothetical protein
LFLVKEVAEGLQRNCSNSAAPAVAPLIGTISSAYGTKANGRIGQPLISDRIWIHWQDTIINTGFFHHRPSLPISTPFMCTLS